MVADAFVDALTACSVGFTMFVVALMTAVDRNAVSDFVDIPRRGRKEKDQRKCEKRR